VFRKFLRIFSRKKTLPMDVPAFCLPDESACTTTQSGLQHSLVKEGSGKTPGPQDKVTVHYAGWLTDGTPFDSSYSRGQTISFPLNGVIAGWTEGLQLMKEGGTSLLVIPPALAYGTSGAPPVIGPNATLVFQVELVTVG
jgi:FKBP-type peptidyl-prolyl cis-trans isomerase